MTLFVTIVHVLTCIFLVSVVLLQHGRGADVGAAFGSGASQTMFGAQGAGNFLTRLTTGAAVVFMLTSLALSYFSNPPTVSELLEQDASGEFIQPPAIAVPEGETEPIPGLEGETSEIPAGFEAIPLPEDWSQEPPAEPAQ
ncbi:MAG: preprotein translocase subunit SecG [Myxococcota bacterium]